MIASEIGVPVTEPAWQVSEVSIEAIVENFDCRSSARNDEGLHEIATVLGDFLQRKATVVEHVGAAFQFGSVAGIDIEQR